MTGSHEVRGSIPLIGQTRNIKKRVQAHNTGLGAAHTSKRRPVRLMHVEEHATRSAAMRRERQLKGWSHAKKNALVRRDLAALHSLSKRRTP